MATETGTATGLEDCFTKILDFVTSDVGLTGESPSQAWQVKRLKRDNLLSTETNLSNLGNILTGSRRLNECMRADSRTLTGDSRASLEGYLFLSNFSNDNNRFIKIRLKNSKAANKLVLKAAQVSPNACFRNFILQGSNDDIIWDELTSITDELNWQSNESREFDFTNTTNYEYYRIIINRLSDGGAGLRIQSIQLFNSLDEVCNQYGSEVILEGKGLGGADSIYTGLRTEYNESAGWHNLFIYGFQGYDQNADFLDQPGAISNNESSSTKLSNPMVPMWDSTIPYWISASGRSIRFMCKISNVYEGFYLGFIKTYSAPSQYPYPLAVGGSLLSKTGSRLQDWVYTNTDHTHSVFFGPATDIAAANFRPSTLYLSDENAQWRGFGCRTTNSLSPLTVSGSSPDYNVSQGSPSPLRSTWPHINNGGQNNGFLPYRECLGGGYLLQPIILLQATPKNIVFGELEGFYDITGFGNTSEDTTVFNSKNYTIFQNSFRSEPWEFCAMELN